MNSRLLRFHAKKTWSALYPRALSRIPVDSRETRGLYMIHSFHNKTSSLPGFSPERTAALYHAVRRYGIPGVIILAATMYTIYTGNYLYNYNNQIEQLTQVKMLLDPALYLNDTFLRRPGTYPSLFYLSIAFLAKSTGIPLPSLYFWSHAITLYCILLALFLISREMFGNDASGYISIILFPSIIVFLGGQPVYLNFMTHTNAAYAALLFSIYFFLKKKLVPSFIILGCAADIHLMYAFFAACLYLPYVLRNRRECVSTKNIVAAGAGLLIASPSLIMFFQSNMPASASIGNDLYIRLLQLRFTHHKFPLRMGIINWCGFFISLAVVVVILCRHPVSKQARSVLLSFLAGLLVVAIPAIVFADLVPIAGIANLSLLRIMVFYTTIAYLVIGHYLEKLLEGNLPAKAAALLLMLLLSNLVLKNAEFTIIIFLAVLLCSLLRIERRALPAAAIACMLLALCFKLPKNDIPWQENERFSRIFIRHDDVVDTDWERCQIWAKQNTGKDDVFLIPPYRFTEPFRIYSERAVVGTFKDGSVLFFNPALGGRWWELMKDFGLDEEYPDKPESRDYHNTLSLLESRYCAIDRVQAEYLAKKYNARYLIMPIKNGTMLGRTVYENGGYRIYRMAN